MALKLDNALLDELGLGALPDSEKQLLLRQIYEKLEMNVGMRLADQMSNEQLDAFEKFVDANDDKGAFQWLESNFPNYKDIVNQEFEKLKAEIRGVAPQILASAQSNAAQQVANGGGQPGQGQPVGQGGQQTGNGQAQSQPQGQPQFQPQPAQPAQGGQPQYAPQPQYQQPQSAGQYQQPQAPQPQQPQYQPPVQQQGHLQPQYGAPTAPSEQTQYQQPQAYPPQQPPAGPNQQ